MINQKSIAVLPFENLSSDPENEYFSDGMTEEIINALTKIEALKVTARTSSFVFKSIKEDVRIIGNKLGVSTVLEGSVRKSGNRVRITAQLIRTDNGFHIWSDSYDRKLDDIFALQDDISLRIADKIRENFGHLEIDNQLVSSPTPDIEVYELFLKASHQLHKFNSENIKKAISMFKEVVELQPDYALAHVNIHYGYNMMAAAGLMPAQEALALGLKHLERSYELDQHLPQYYHSMGWHSLNNGWDFKAANNYLQRAIELNSNYADAHQKLFINLALDGNLTLAKHHLDRAIELDPLAAMTNYFQAYYYYLIQDFKKSDECFRRTFELDSSFLVGYSIFALSQVIQKKKEPIFDRINKMPNIEGSVAEKLIMEALASLITGNSEEIAGYVSGLKEAQDCKNEERVRFFLIFIEALRGSPNHACDLIDIGIKNKEPLLTLLKVDPLLKPLHSMTRFKGQLEIIFQLSDHEIPNKKKAQKETQLDTIEVENTLAKLKKLLEEDAIHRESSLSMRELAETISIHPNKLSRILNDVVGKNFNDYINGFRLIEFQKRAIDPANKHLTLLGLAYESGFNSKSVFNDYFKKQTGLTPKAWLKKHVG